MTIKRNEGSEGVAYTPTHDALDVLLPALAEGKTTVPPPAQAQMARELIERRKLDALHAANAALAGRVLAAVSFLGLSDVALRSESLDPPRTFTFSHHYVDACRAAKAALEPKPDPLAWIDREVDGWDAVRPTHLGRAILGNLKRRLREAQP